jgi:transcription termination/antitermination protein NusA
MQQDLNRVIEQVSKEKGIDKTILISALENAMISAAKKTFGHQRKIEAQFNPEIGEVELFEAKTVVETVQDVATEITRDDARENLDPDAEVGDELLCKLDSSVFGRIAAQAAKQNIVQRVRDAEREIIFNEFKGREGQLVNGIVQRFEKRNIIVNLGRTDAILPEKEQVPRERYRQGDRIRAFIVSVEITSRGPQIVLSRTHPGMLIQLFAQEVPEIYEGIVEVKGAAREPGGRAKIAVVSHDPDVDPVGACVGMKGTRVQSVVQELRGEKIDIVHWIPDQAEYVCRALAPAKVAKIIIDDDDHTMEVVVPDDMLSLAIGKKGQNVRLASRLTGWRIDVCSEAEAEEETRKARQSINAIPSIGDIAGELLYQAGFKSAEDVADSELEDILDVEGISKEKAEALHKSAKQYVAEKRAQEAELAASAAAASAAAAALAAEAALDTERPTESES